MVSNRDLDVINETAIDIENDSRRTVVTIIKQNQLNMVREKDGSRKRV